MNPAFPVLLALSLAGLAVFRRSELGLAWTVVGLAGVALLAHPLLLADGVPSNSGLLSRSAPWQSAAGEGAGIPELVDVTFQIEPWLLHVRHELREGRPPFWNPHQFAGAPFWSNGQSAPLFPLHLLFSALPLSWGLVLLPWLRVVVAGLGAYRLARELEVGRDGALLAAVVYPLSGRFASFLLFPMGNAMCLVPWAFLAVERLARGGSAFALLAGIGGLQLLAGHPETAFFTALAGALYLALRGCRLPLPAWGAFAGGWAAAAAVAAVQIVPLLLALPQTSRWQETAAGEAPALATLASLWLRFLLPDAFGHAADGSWWGPFAFVPTTVYLGASTLPLAAAALAPAGGAGGSGGRTDRRRLALAATALFCFAAAYHLPGLRELLLALPLVGRALHHYLLPVMSLALALLAAAGLERVRAGGGGKALAVAAAGTWLALVAGWAAFGAEWQARGAIARVAAWAALAAGTPLALAGATRLRAPLRAALAPALVALAVLDLAVAHARSVPGAALAAVHPRTAAIAFLCGRPERVAGIEAALRPNTALVHGLYDLRGDDTLKVSRYEAAFARHLGEGHPTYFRPITRWGSPWLDRLGVRWVIAPPGADPPEPSWTAVYAGADATVFERPSALPLVRFEPDAPGGRIEVLGREPGRWEIAWQTSAPRRLVVAENWDPGWRARLDGEPVAVEVVEDLFLGVPVGPGRGRLTLTYLPRGIRWGAILSLAGLACVGVGLARRRVRS